MRRLSALLVLVLMVPGTAMAAGAKPEAAGTPSGITVSPAFQQVQILADEQQHELDFSVTNHRPDSESIQLTSQDFNELSDTGGLFFVGSKPNTQQKKYGLASWLELPQKSVVVAPQQTVKITAFIRNNTSLAPGGHYGALMLGLSEGSTPGKSNQVAVRPIASSLIFLNKIGGDVHRLKLAGVESKHGPFSLPDTVTLRFFNDGNTHVIPRGTVSVTDPSGKVVSQGTINQDSFLMLPQVYRKYDVTMKKLAVASKAGRYKLTVQFRFDGYDQFRTYQSTILLATPGVYVAFGVLGLLTLTIIVYYVRFWKGPNGFNPASKRHEKPAKK